ncbi:hypothetical protein KJ966_29455 [bacterium]|nr:hypothetical protein [bacterium]
MAKGNLKTQKTLKKQTDDQKKSGKGKWIFLIFILILVLLGAGLFYWFGNPLTMFFNEREGFEESQMQFESGLNTDMAIIQDVEQVIEVEKKTPVVKAVTPSKTPLKRFYIRVEDCTAITCEQEVTRFLKQEKIPYLKRSYSRKTKYFELISTSIYTLQTAKAKMDLLKMQKELVSDPFLIKENNRYRISMGTFPQEETGVRIKSELALLYPKIKIEFDIRPKNQQYTVTSIYAGPFKKNIAEKVLQRIHDYLQYETSQITQKL